LLLALAVALFAPARAHARLESHVLTPLGASTGPVLRVSAASHLRRHLRFALAGVSRSAVARARLDVFVYRGAPRRLRVHVAGRGRTHLLARSRPHRGRWTHLDVTAAVRHNRRLVFVLATASRRAILLCGRASESCRPRLVIQTRSKPKPRPKPTLTSPPPPPPPPPAPPPPLASAAVDPVFKGDWETGTWAPWTNLQTVIGGDVSRQFALVHSPLRQGSYAARFTVNPGDVYNGTSGERSEVIWSDEKEVEGSDYWYAWSTMFAADWVSPDWGIFLQWHSDLPFVPPLAFTVFGEHVVLSTNTGVMGDGVDRRRYYTLLTSLDRGAWHDFVMHVHWSGTNGSMAVWHRLGGTGSFVKVLDVAAPTLQTQNGVVSPNYQKEGLYRSPGAFADTLYQDGYVRGSSVTDVSSAFGDDAGFQALAANPN
jgi:hypothetical protein